MAKAKKLPSGSWRCLSYVGTENEKRIYKSFTAETKNEAEYQASKYLRDNKGKTKSNATKTLDKAIGEYIESKSNILSPSTIKAYKSIKTHRLQGIAKENIYNLTADKIQKEINSESLEHSHKTIKNIYGLLSATLAYFMPERKFKISFPQKPKREIYIPSDEEVQNLFEVVKGTKMEVPVLLAACCGLRRSEIAALNIKDVDFINSTISINKAKVYDENNDIKEKLPKSYSGTRTIEVSKFILDKIKIQGYIIKDTTPNCLTDRFRRLLKANEIKHFRFHDLRHYHASVMLALNVPDKYAMERMGHSTSNMLKTVYQHIMSKKKDEVSNTINNFFEYMQHKKQHDI